jgi:hypothetical protein
MNCLEQLDPRLCFQQPWQDSIVKITHDKIRTSSPECKYNYSRNILQIHFQPRSDNETLRMNLNSMSASTARTHRLLQTYKPTNAFTPFHNKNKGS